MIESKVHSHRNPAFQGSTAADLLAEMESAFEELRRYIDELALVIDEPELDRGRLTTLRLKIAQLRLVRGLIIARIAVYLEPRVSAAEAQLLKELRADHDRMMGLASKHTGKWTLEAIAADWSEYRKATSQITRCWMEKVGWEHEVLCPLLKRAA